LGKAVKTVFLSQYLQLESLRREISGRLERELEEADLVDSEVDPIFETTIGHF
jgi:TnpA family transposase